MRCWSASGIMSSICKLSTRQCVLKTMHDVSEDMLAAFRTLSER